MEKQQAVELHAPKAWPTGLSVRDFRNYDACRIDIEASNILLLGENGAGKTNLMEAVSRCWRRAGAAAGTG